MFKVGQKVVYVGCHLPEHPGMIYPKIGEICIIKDIDNFIGRTILVIKNYDKAINGRLCGIIPDAFRSLDETFAESVLENIKEQIKEEELVLI